MYVSSPVLRQTLISTSVLGPRSYSLYTFALYSFFPPLDFPTSQTIRSWPFITFTFIMPLPCKIYAIISIARQCHRDRRNLLHYLASSIFTRDARQYYSALIARLRHGVQAQTSLRHYIQAILHPKLNFSHAAGHSKEQWLLSGASSDKIIHFIIWDTECLTSIKH